MLSGFLSGTPTADLFETNILLTSKAFLGPLEQVGFLDITDRLHEEGLYEQINEPTFSTMTTRGRTFGIPRDVHPVLLAYRSDLVEAAGIDVSEIETWDDFFRVMSPLMGKRDSNGHPDRYLLNLSEHTRSELIVLVLQNDGELFDEDGSAIFASERNAQTLATVTSWIAGPKRVTTQVARSSLGNREQLEGLVMANLMPDWLVGHWELEIPQLAGKIKLMPLPAFERGGRRTSVWGGGGTMVGINKRSLYLEESWEIAKDLYTSPEVAEAMWRKLTILSPVTSLWDEPFYHEPHAFCSGQRIGKLYIEAAPHVPRRPSSPYTSAAYEAISNVAIALRSYAETHAIYEPEALKPEALRLLQYYQDRLEKLRQRNVFQENNHEL